MRKRALTISILLILVAIIFAGCRTVDTRDDDWRTDRGSSYSSEYHRGFNYGYRYRFHHGFNYGPHYPRHFRYPGNYYRGF